MLQKCLAFFLLRAPAHHSFTFNLRFLYELKHKVRLSKTVWGSFHFRFLFVFIKVFIFVQIMDGLQNVRIPFKIKITEKAHTALLPDLWFLSCNKKFQNSMISSWVGAPQNWPSEKILDLENRIFETSFFLLNSNF